MKSLVVIADKSSIVGQVRLAARYAAGVRVEATIDGRAAVGEDLAALEPDVVIVGEMCQRVNTLARLREISACCPGATVLLLAGDHDSGAARDAFAAGAHAVLRSDVGVPSLGALLGAIARGHLVISGVRAPEDMVAQTTPVAPVEHLRLVPAQDARRTGTSA
jgi:DNA-binding NarL/FixJ family response regulator